MTLGKRIRFFILLLMAGFAALAGCILYGCGAYLAELVPPLAVYGLGGALCLPCLVILALALEFARAVEQDRVFVPATAQRLRWIAWIFYGDCGAFLVAILALLVLGEGFLAALFALIDLVGFAIGVLLHILSDYIRRAGELQEEVEGTL